jgi:hypothetical protein
MASLLQQRGEPVGLGPLASGELSGEHVEVDLRQVDQRVGLAPSAAARMTYSSAPTERSSSASTASATVIEVGLGRARDKSATRSASTRIAATCAWCVAAAWVGQERLEELARLPGRGRGSRAGLLIDQQRLDRGVTQGDVVEPGGVAQLDQVDAGFEAHSDEHRVDGLAERCDQRVDVLDRRVDPGLGVRGPVDRRAFSRFRNTPM